MDWSKKEYTILQEKATRGSVVAGGLIKYRANRRVIPSFYAFLIVFVVTLLVILVNKIPMGPRIYPDHQYQLRLKSNYFKPPADNYTQLVFDTKLLIKPQGLEGIGDDENARLIVIVSSSMDHFDQRQAIRQTWLKWVNYHQQKLFFIIGKPAEPLIETNSSSNSSSLSPPPISISLKPSPSTVQTINFKDEKLDEERCKVDKMNRQIVQEAKSFNDLIQYDFLDSYYNLTLKSLLILRFFNQEILNLTQTPTTYSSSSASSFFSPISSSFVPGMDLKIKKPIFLLKVDDDMFINVHNLVKLIDKLLVAFKVKKFPWKKQEGYKILLGGLIKKAQPVRDPRSKYFVPFTVYPHNEYPNYLSGTGYLMSSDVARSIFITATFATRCKYFFLEDVFITGLCAAKAVKMYDDYTYYDAKSTHGHPTDAKFWIPIQRDWVKF